MTLLITGATGEIGSRVVAQLLARGIRPRLFVRDAARAQARFGDRVDLAVGDLTQAESLAAALIGVEAIFLVNSGPEIAVRDRTAARLARAAGVQRLVKLSSLDAQQQIGTGLWHAQGEAAVRELGIPYTFVQPTGFMSNVLWWARSIKAEGLIRSSTGEGPIPFIHPDDIATVATAALTSSAYEGQSLAITGPRALSYPEMLACLGTALGRPLRFQLISDEEAARGYAAATGDPPAVVEAHISIWRAIRHGLMATVTNEVERVLCRPPLRFEHWVEQNLAAFR